jgi:cellulase/cellobiase CelA1
MRDNKIYNQNDYLDAIDFALNYPPDFKYVGYSDDFDIFIVDVQDGGWYSNVKLQGNFVRSCLKWQGYKQWKK